MKDKIKYIVIGTSVIIFILLICFYVQQRRIKEEEYQKIVAEYRSLFDGVWENTDTGGFDKISINCEDGKVIGFIDKSSTWSKKEDYISESTIDSEDYDNYQLISHRGLCTDTYTYSQETGILTAVDSVNNFTEKYVKVSDKPSNWKDNTPDYFEETKSSCVVRHCDNNIVTGKLCSEHKDASICPVCEYGYTNAEDKKKIAYANMCTNCYNNYKWSQDVKEGLKEYEERH